MKNKANLKVVHRQQKNSSFSQEEIYQQLSEVKEDLEVIFNLLNQHLDVDMPFSYPKNERGDTGKPGIASFC